MLGFDLFRCLPVVARRAVRGCRNPFPHWVTAEIQTGSPGSPEVSVIIVQSFSPWVRSEVVFIVPCPQLYAVAIIGLLDFVASSVSLRSNTAHCIFLALLIVGLWPDYAQPFFCIDHPSVTWLACIEWSQSDALKLDSHFYLLTLMP